MRIGYQLISFLELLALALFLLQKGQQSRKIPLFLPRKQSECYSSSLSTPNSTENKAALTLPTASVFLWATLIVAGQLD